MEETFSQIEGAAAHSVGDVNVSITSSGSVVGQGVTASAGALDVCGGNLDSILRSFGGIEGGNVTIGGKSAAVVRKAASYGGKIVNHLEGALSRAHEDAEKLDHVASLAKEAVDSFEDSTELNDTLERIHSFAENAASEIRNTADAHLGGAKEGAGEFLQQGGQFLSAIDKLGGRDSLAAHAGVMSMAFAGMNNLQRVSDTSRSAMRQVRDTRDSYFGQRLTELNSELESHLDTLNIDQLQFKNFMNVWNALLQQEGCASGGVAGGAAEGAGPGSANQLAARLNKARTEMKNMINKFIDAFGININGIVDCTNDLSKHLGKDIDYSETTITFLDTFSRMEEYLNDPRRSKSLYQHLLELNLDQVDSKEIKDRFLSSMRDLAERASALGSQAAPRAFAQNCRDVITTVNKYNDMIKSHREAMKGGSTDTMNELFSIDTAKIDIVGFMNPLDNLKVAIRKLRFFRNLAVFRSNLSKTSDELAVYSKDYTKSVGQAIGEAITKIKTEYDEIMRQVSDNKSGMGLEIDMYNDSRSRDDDKISKEKLKIMYKWQCDARVGLYKTVEAIDLYLLHFTDSIAKNPDAVADLQKMLAATRIIAKWYDNKAGDNLVRLFESFRDDIEDGELDAANFVSTTYADDNLYANLESKIGGDRAARIYERSRRAVEGVVVLKNIISYFITIGEKYGNLKTEKNIIMAPSNIYKNLVNYIWVSALDMNTMGTEILTESNETKRILTFEDTKVKIAQVTQIDPEVMGINFNRHSIDKLRILKCFNDLSHLSNFTGNFTDEDLRRIKQFVSGVFARLGKTKYIFEMIKFGVYDFTHMQKDQITAFIEYLQGFAAPGRLSIIIDFPGDQMPVSTFDASVIATRIAAFKPDDRSSSINILCEIPGVDTDNMFVSLKQFNANDISRYYQLCGMIAAESANYDHSFMSGFLSTFTRNDDARDATIYSTRTMHALKFCITNMLQLFQTNFSNSVFAIDDTYFILTIKAIAGKIMAVTGVNRLFKDPNAYSNTIIHNPTRLIMGGASSGESEIIDGAVELYVRLPLLVEFYRSIFDDGNKEYKQEIPRGQMDDERVSYVPEVGNIWTGLIVNIFDKSKHIESGLYSTDNMSKIVSEINSIYKHYKGSVPDDQLTRHAMVELVGEINRRYGVVKRQELLNYYKAVNATKRNTFDIAESNYTNNDLDILNEAEEFEEKSPSDEFVKFKSSITNATSTETKINKLTDYKILKDFRGRISNVLRDEEHNIYANQDTNRSVLSMVDRIRQLKAAIKSQSSNSDKYSMIIKAIEESDAMNQSSNDIFACFHEFVVMPLRTVYQMHYALERFLKTISALVAVSTNVTGVPEFGAVRDNPILNTEINGVTFGALLNGEMSTDATISKLRSAGGELLFGGEGSRIDLVSPGGVLQLNYDSAEEGMIQALLLRTLLQVSTNSSDLVNMKISSTDRITIDFSEYQKVCEYLVANVKYMVDKFTGLVPSALITRVTNPGTEGSVYWLEQQLVNGIFNKMNKSESKRDLICIDNLNKLMPVVSQIIFTTRIRPESLLYDFTLDNQRRSQIATSSRNALPIIRDAFLSYSTAARTFAAGGNTTYISNLLFNPSATSTLLSQSNFGFLQTFNILVSQYLNDMYDPQSRKIYTKAFETFAGNALVDAMNGQSFPDFDNRAAGASSEHYDIPASQTVLSSTLAHVMKVMNNRVNPVSGMKIHEVGSLQEVAPHVMERYRALIPMYVRTFKAFIARCRVLRKVIARMNVSTSTSAFATLREVPSNGSPNTLVRENDADDSLPFVTANVNTLLVAGVDIKDNVSLYLDEVVNAMTSLLQDVQNVQKELLETDTTISLYFDVKKDFTKNYFMSSKELPYAPLSILAMGFAGNDAVPIHGRDNIDNKFLYGLRSLMMDDFKLTSAKVPYLKKLLSDFNGFSIKSNQIADSKFNDVLSYVGRATNYIYDLRFFNGRALSHIDVLSNITPFLDMAGTLTTFQERNDKMSSMTLVESVNVIDSRNKVADYVKEVAVTAGPSMVATPAIPGATVNPRRRVIMVNIVDMNIMPINVHSLMREIPLANLYNYAMTFDDAVDTMPISRPFASLLKSPYAPIVAIMDGRSPSISINGIPVPLSTIEGDRSLRYIGDVLVSKIMKKPSGDALDFYRMNENSVMQRLRSKLFHNLIFLTTVQYAIKTKVKSELEFINTRVVTNNAAVSNTITNATTDLGDAVDDTLFQF